MTKTPTPIDEIHDALARIAKALPGTTDVAPASRKLTLNEFISHLRDEVAHIQKDEPGAARQRVAMLERSVKSVQAQLAKLSFEAVGVGPTLDVETAYRPLGGAPVEGLTTAADQSSTEISMTSAGAAASSSGTFASNLADVAKALEQLTRKLAASATTAAASEKPAAEPSRAAKAAPVGWPLDLNTPAFRDATDKADDAPAWGYDPDEDAQAEDDPP